jgi:NhaA family Na+:H+ antiporter
MAMHSELPTLVRDDEVLAASATERAADWVLRPFQQFAHKQVAGSVLLLACTAIALVWANSVWHEAYESLLQQPIVILLGRVRLDFDLHHWINDGLMAVFFFAVGLEIKRELLVGELAEPRKAILPIAGAAGGMVVPALVYVAFNTEGPGLRGWGIPMATDIAFALGALVALGHRIPDGLKVFLVALAIVDDLGAVMVIAFFYTASLNFAGLGLAALFLVALIAVNRAGVRLGLVYAALGAGVWYGMLVSGVHATLAGVLTALTVPASVRVVPEALARVVRRGADAIEARGAAGSRDVMNPERFATIAVLSRWLAAANSPLQRFEHAVQPWVTFVILPVFALCNAGVRIDASAIATIGDPVPVGIAAGLVVGKQVGVFVASWLAVRAGLAALPERVTWRHMYGTAWLAGIGFTMSLFISDLAFAGTGFESEAKLGILIGSVVAAAGGILLLLTTPRISAGAGAET